MKLYWHSFDKPGLPVTLPAMTPKNQHFRWTGIYGVQIGLWFIGIVRGGPGAPCETAERLDTPPAPNPRKQGAEG